MTSWQSSASTSSAYHRADVFGVRRPTNLRSFLLGGLLGGLAGLVAAGGLRRPAADSKVGRAVDGIAAFEEAPCHGQWRAREDEERLAKQEWDPPRS